MPLPIALDYRPALLSPAGIGRATRELARALAARDDVDVHLFAHSLARTRIHEAPPARAHLHRWPIPGRSLPWLARLGWPAERLAGGARVFHWTDYVQPPVGTAAAVLTVHDLAFVRDASWHGADAAFLRERTRAAIAKAKALVVPSHTTAADLRAFAPTAPSPHVIPFGADHVPTLPSATASERPYVLCVGTLEPRKNHLALLEAWRHLGAKAPNLVVVGRIGWECAAIVAALREAVARGAATWLPDCDDRRLWPLLANARLLAYPSLWEGFGFPPLEAMALGVPVVAVDNAPMRELGSDAFVFAAEGSAPALAAALDRALHDEPARAVAITRGRARATAFRWQDCAAAHAALYHEVTAC